uniref:Chitinase B n=1 Tax=Clostridioides difficile TaxID=1496 RepID=A0A386JC21_CLODI|nr:immunoglobulin-like domain-containing protein [Clostridioides difficile]AYD68710.1 chitinase B [Clostridioides difficile]
MYNKKVISVLLSTIIASSTGLGITPSINVFADNKNYENNLENEKFLLDMGEYENDDGILSFPDAKGVIKEQANLFFNFDGESNVKISYIKNGNKMEGITYEPSLKSRVINIRIENQQELEEVLKSLEIKCDANVNFSIKLTSVPKGIISSNGIGQEEAVDGDLGSHFRADGKGWWQLIFDKETELDTINLTFGRKNGAIIEGLKDGTWTKIGEANDYAIDLYSRETQTIKVDKGIYKGVKVIPNLSDDNMSRLCEISFDETEAQHFNYTDSPSLNLGEPSINDSFVTFPSAVVNGFDKLNLKLEYSTPIGTEYKVNGNKINSDEKVVITEAYDRKTINEILKTLKLNTKNQKVKIDVSLVDMELKKTFPDGTVTTGTYYGAGYPANVIDCNVNTYWNAPSESGNINFKFPSQTKVDTIKLKVSPSTTIKNQYTITGKKGGSSEVIGQTVEIVKGNEMNTVDIPIIKKGDYDEINVNSSWIATGGLGSAWATIHEVILNSNLEEELASDSVTVDKIESMLNLELGEKKVINNKITFPDAKGNTVGFGSSIVFELNDVENQDTSIKYQLNGEEIIKKDKIVKIEINSQKELDEILKSLEITFDELEGCSLKIFSVSSDADMENLSWQIPKNFVASGIGYGNNQPSNVFKGSVGWNAGTYNTSMYLKNINNVYLSAIRYNSKNALIVRGKNNGTWKDIGSFGANQSNAKFDVVPNNYEELEFYSYGRDWAHIYDLEFFMSDKKKECLNISIDKANFEIGDFNSDGKGNITFPSAAGKISTNTSLSISFKNGYNRNLVTTYSVDGEEKKENNENIVINIENNEQLKEVLSSLKISHDNTSNLDMSFSLNFNSGKKITKDIKIEMDDSLDMGEIQHSDGVITFKNATGKIRDKADLNFVSKTELEIRYSINGEEITKKGKDIVIEGLTQDTLNELLRSFSISYDEYEGCEFSISLLGKPVTITKNYSIPQVQGNLELDLGDYENDGNGNVLFPNAKGLLYRKGNLNINFEKGFSNDIEIKYKLNDIEYTKKQNSLSIALSNQEQLDEVLKTLKIKCDSSLEYNLNITLAEERYIPLGTTSDKPEALTGGWYSGKGGNTAIITFNSPLKISTVSISKTSGVDNRFYIKGLKNNIWKDIGNFTIFYPNYDYTKLREIDVQRDSYDAISIYYVVNNGWGSANVSKLGFLDKVSTNIKIKPDINLKVTLVDNLEKAKLKWNSDLEAYAYNIYVKKKDDKSWTLSKSVTSDINEIDDYSIKDSVAPLVPEYKIQDELKKGIQLNSDDLGSEYSYYINAIDRNGNKIGTSNVENINVQSDFKEFVYEVSNSSTIPLELKNKSNGFIQFRDLVDKNYLYVASVDNAGNISAIKTIPILGLFVDEPPVINVPGDSSLKANSKIDVNEGVSATDEIDGDLTSKINTKIISPKGEVVSDIDTNILGNWIIEYKVTDSKGQTTEYIRKINVIKNINLKLNVGELLTTSKFTQFPNAKIESKEQNEKVNGIKMYFSNEFNDSMKVHYTLNGIEKITTNRSIVIDDELTIKDAENLIKSVKIEHDNSKKFNFNIVLSSNDAESIIYNYENNHYYKFIYSKGISLEDAKKEASKQEFLGNKGYLVKIDSESEKEVLSMLTEQSFWNEASTDNKEKNGFVVEFGMEDKLPSPDTINIFDYESIINIEPFKSKQDIVLNTLVDKKENKVILDWNDVKDISYYKVFQKKNDIGDFQVISSDKNESYFEDIEGKDINEPTTPIYKLYDTGIKQGLKFDSEDVASKFEYYVEGVSEFGDVTHTSNKKMVEIKSGLEGFSYEVTDNATPSSNLGDVINSSDGFISAKELASKKYIHIISIDKAGNKSQIVTLPITGLFIDNPPVLRIGGNISVSQNEEYDVMKNISAEDDYDGDLTKDIKVSIKNPNGKITDKFDTNILGKWTIEYSVKDSKEQESKVIKYITVKEDFDYLNLDLGEANKKRFLVNFPDAKITNNSNELINGIKLYINEGFNNSILIKYNDKGVKKSVKGQQVILKDKYTTEEAEELIKSIEIEHDNSTSFTFNVRLQNNNVDDMVYNPQNGNYYQFVEAKRISWKNAKLEAEKMEYKGLKGHLATIKSKHELDLFNSLTTKTTWLGATDEEKEGQWKWVTGELVKFTNWCSGEPNNFGGTEHYMVSIKNSKGLWNDTNNSPDPYWTDIEGFVVEFENDKNNDSSIIYKYEDTAHIQKIVSNQDIVLNSTNDNKSNCVNLSWNKYKDSEYYKVFRRELNSNSDEFKTISESTKENYLKDVDGKDITPPVYDFSLIFDKEMSSRLEFHAEEVGTTYEYKIESYDKDDYQTAYSNVSKATVTSKFKGYSYIVDENPDTELDDNIINNTDGKFSFENITYNTYLHIKAIDEQGNATKTKHIKLADETHNNEPRITVKGKNRVIKIGEEFNKLDGVKAYDLEDGDLTDKLVVEGEVNNQIKGVYEIKYSVEDSKGLKSEVIVKVNVTGDMKLNIEEPKKDELVINWNEVKNAVKYKLYRTNINGYDFEEKGVFNDTTFIDNSANDVSSPIITYLNEVIIGEETSKIGRLTILTKNIIKLADKGINKDSEQNTELKLLARDLASTYRYFVEAIDINGNVINSSEIKNGSVSVGLAGFNYIIDDKEDTEAANFVNAKNVSDIDISNSKFKFLHVRAIDLNGNVSQTAHHLISSKYDTNHVPVIRGVNTIRVKEGDKFDPFKGISAYDTEDGDLTSKIEIEGKVNSDVNGKYLLTYKVEDSQGNKREVKRNIIVYADMEIKVTPDFEENNLVISWEENPLKEKVFYEVRKYDYEIGNYKTVGYTEDLNFVDKNAKDIYGPKVNNIHGSDMDTDELKDKITLNINARDVGASEKYQVRTRLKEDNLILRDMTSEEGNEWGVTGSISGVVKSFKWKLSNKREDNLKSGMITTSISTNKIEFEHKGYKYIHVVPIDSYDNEGDIVHYEIGKPPAEEVIEPPIINITGVPIINGVSTATIMIGDEFKIMKGVTAKDYKGQDLTNFIKVKGFVNRYEKGEYELVYSVTDFKGQETSRVCKIRVIDYSEQLPDSKPNEINSPPEVNFWDEDYIYVGEKYGEDRILNGIRVIDAEDGDITNKITYETNLDINAVGTYVILYSVSDSDGNKVKFTRVVYVIEKGADKPNLGNNNENWQNGRWARIKTYNKYLNVGDTFNIKSGVYAYDDVDGDITAQIKASGIVNTIKPGAYNVTYKVKNSDNNTTVAGATIFVKDGGWDNNNGEEPNPNPDWGDNDNDDSHNNHIPTRPDQPNQDEDNVNGDKLPNIDDDAGKDDNKDIFIDKDGNKVFPDGTIEKPDGTEIKPNEEGEKPTIDDNGNIIVPPGGIIIFPDGTIQIPEGGAILKPDGVIIYPKKDEEVKDKDNNSKEESSNSISSLINDEKIEKEIDNNNIEKNNPPTGDTGIGIFWGIGILSTIGLIFNRRKK